MGVERVVELLSQQGEAPPQVQPQVYVITGGLRAERTGVALVEHLRDALPGLRIQLNLGGGNFKAQFRRADRSGAVLGLILGEAELERGVAALKPLRIEAGQEEVALEALVGQIPAMLSRLAGSGTQDNAG